MPDFVISGARGFIGRNLIENLRAKGFSVCDARDFQKSPSKAKIFVNCANIASNPFASARLLRSNYASAAGNAECFIQLQSFVGLHGSGDIDVGKFNCNKRPFILSFYALGKLLQEYILCQMTGRGTKIILAYLPAVLGTGGDWSTVIELTKRNGVMLPPLNPESRPNFIDVSDVVFFVIEAHRKLYSMTPALQRVILCRRETQKLSWIEFLSGKRTPDGVCAPVKELPYRLSQKQKVTEALRAAISLALIIGWYSGFVILLEHLWMGGCPPSAPKGPPRESIIWFPGIFRHIVAKQPYIPPTAE